MRSSINNYPIEDKKFWQTEGKAIAYRNLWISIPNLLLSFVGWYLWSVIVIRLNDVGFNLTNGQLFTLVSLPGLVGSTLRIIYAFVIPYVGGRNWTVITSISLLIPLCGIGFVVQDPTTPYWVLVVLAMLSGFGCANFSSSNANISLFFPKRLQGTALGLNSGLGNVGISVIQLLGPWVITFAIVGFGASQTVVKNGVESQVYLQNAAFVWVIPIIICVALAYFGMNNVFTVKPSLSQQLVIFKRKHNYLVNLLYLMSFGSYSGFAVVFLLLTKKIFPEVSLMYLFIGPLLGALTRSYGGYLADKINSGALITFVSIVFLIVGITGVIYFTSESHKSFIGFYLMFMVLFIFSGVANGAVFRMIAVIFPPSEKPTVVGFTSAIGSYGSFILPQLLGMALALTGAYNLAFYILIAYYVICLFILWKWYLGSNAEINC